MGDNRILEENYEMMQKVVCKKDENKNTENGPGRTP